MPDRYTGTVAGCSHNWGVKDIQGSSVLWKCAWCDEEMWIERAVEKESK